MLKAKVMKNLYKKKAWKQAPLQARTVTVGEVEVSYYLTNAERDLPVLICLPGLYEVKEHLAPFAQAMGKAYRVLVIDWLSHGQTSHNPLYWTIEGQVSFLEQVLAALRAEYDVRALIGQSFGATLLLMHANLAPEECLILGNLSHLRTEKTERCYTEMIENEHQAPYIVRTQADFEQLMYVYFSQAEQLKNYDWRQFEAQACAQGELLQPFIEQWYAEFSLFFAESFLEHARSKKTLLVWGSEDPFADARKGQIVKWTIPHSQIVFVEQASQLPFSEQPERTAAIVSQFLQQAGADSDEH